MGSLLKRLAALLLLCDFTRPMHTGVIYVGQACRREALWKVWASHEEALLGPLRKRGEVSLFAWFDKGWQRQLQRKGGGWRELELGETAEQQCMGEARERLVAARKLERRYDRLTGRCF